MADDTLHRSRLESHEGVSWVEKEEQAWFGKKESWLGFGPITRQGRIVSYLYVLLVVVAVFTCSRLPSRLLS